VAEPEPLEERAIRVQAVPDCPVCGGVGSPHHRDLTDRLCGAPGRWSFHRCVAEGNLWLNPRPIDEDLGLCYPAGYFTHGAASTGGRAKGGAARSAKERLRRRILAGAYGYSHLSDGGRAGDRLGSLLALVPPLRWEATHHMGAFMPTYQKHGRLLDVGCGNGHYLARMQAYGWEVAGIEIDAKAAEIARSERGLTVHNGPVEGAPFPAASFDVVTSQQVLEHIAEPHSFMKAISAYLRPGGHLVLATPNARSLGHRLFGTECYSLDPPRHLVLYTLSSIRQLVRQTAGLELISLRTHARIARKVYLQWRSVRQSGLFRGPGVRVTLSDRLAALLFSYAESAGAGPLALGEEIEVVAARRD
jgi:2-polyprenyl-3-methyl-5-hydroxy-6-metoxy-1,4-benzoquinol methylase